MKKFEIRAMIPVETIITGIYHITANTSEEALDIFRSESFDPSKCLVDSFDVGDCEPMNFKDSYINYIKEIND